METLSSQTRTRLSAECISGSIEAGFPSEAIVVNVNGRIGDCDNFVQRCEISVSEAFRSHTVANDSVSITVVPEIGAKIVSLRNLLTGREWMWRPRPHTKLFRNHLTDSFEASPLIGADECLPTIAACRCNGLNLPDHGELWRRAWRIDLAALRENRIQTSIKLDLLPLELERSICLLENEAVFDYVLTSRSTKPEKFLWAFHPLMPLEEEDRIELPPEIRSVQIGALNGFAVPQNRLWNWPAPVPGVHLDRLDFGLHVPGYVKLFADFARLSSGFTTIRRSKEQLSFRFEPSQIPVLGIWITRGAWNGYTHLAIEPANAATDSFCDLPSNNHTTVAHGQ